jgi:AcrR family transcriptional regulator
MSTADCHETQIQALGRPAGQVSPRERLLGEASKLFYARGIRAVGIDLIIDRANVAKATFYRHFPSKVQLVVAYLDRRQDAWLTWFTAEVTARAATPAEQLLVIFELLAEAFAEPAFNGCALINAVVELGKESPEVVERAALHRAKLHSYISRVAKEADVRDPSDLANRWMLLIDGAYIGAQRGGGANAAHQARAAAEVLLAAPS